MLFWKYRIDFNHDNYKFYEFIKCYDKYNTENNHNKEHNVSGQNEIMAVLDGQQRLTALFIGLKGYMNLKKPRYRAGRAENYEKKFIYLNLLKNDRNTENEDLENKKDNLRSNLIILPVAQFLLQNNTTELDIHNMKLIENWVQRSILLHKCRGRGFSVFCKFFKYPSPEAYASPSPSWGEGSGLHRPGCDKILGTDCASRPRMTGGRGANYFGRSMIEMLGVLAIIGVLSVGGIAGYSKAMENMYFSNTENKVGNRFVFDIWFARSASSNNSLAYNLCRAFYQDVGVAMSSTVLAMIVQGGKHYVYGETVCHDGTDDKDNSRHCLRDLTLPEISDICKTCQSTNCAVYLVF